MERIIEPVTRAERCNLCNTNLEEVYIGNVSSKFRFCVRCPKCHIIYDLR